MLQRKRKTKKYTKHQKTPRNGPTLGRESLIHKVQGNINNTNLTPWDWQGDGLLVKEGRGGSIHEGDRVRQREVGTLRRKNT